MGTPVMAGKKCANCIYWCGEREINVFFGRVELKDFSVKGKCSNPKGYYNQQCPCLSQCNAFEKHPAVK